MERERPGASTHVRGRALTVLVLLCVGLLGWGILQALRPSSPVLRHVPSQAPARQEPAHRLAPTLDPEPLS